MDKNKLDRKIISSKRHGLRLSPLRMQKGHRALSKLVYIGEKLAWRFIDWSLTIN